MIEWGHYQDESPITEPDGDINFYRRKSESDFGYCVRSEDVKKKVCLDDLIAHGLQWHHDFGQYAGTYPRNCRGYIDSVLKEMFEIPIVDWKFLDLHKSPKKSVITSAITEVIT